MTVTTAVYPAGDTACAQSPLRTFVVTYPLGVTPQTGIGYLLTYAGASDPIVSPPGSINGFFGLQTTIYSSGNGTAQIDTRLDERAQPTSFLTGFSPAPSPGTFPETFPTGLPQPSLYTGFSPSGYYATSESGAASVTGTATNYAGFTAPFTPSQVGNLGTLDSLAVSASGPDSAGRETLSWSDSDPAYAVDFGNSQEVLVTAGSFPLAQGATSWTLTPVSDIGVRSSPLNFPKAVSGTALFGPDGTILACSHTYTDAANQVSAQLTCNADGSATLAATDLIAHKALTNPASIVLDAAGQSNSYSFTFDSSQDVIMGFHITPSQT